MNYSKTQYGKLIISLFAIISLIGFLSFFFLRQVDEIPPLVIFGFPVIMFLTGLLFYKLNVSIEKDGVRLKYGIGLISLKFKMDEVESLESIKTPWYYGLGIRITPKGILYNIQGLKAVRIHYLKDGKSKKVMIGTDEPEELMKALNSAFGK
jgi:hypothetical protein